MQKTSATLASLCVAMAIGASAASSDSASSLIVPGKAGNAMKFDGAHYVRPPGLGTLEKGTISVWIRPDKNPEQIITLLNTDHWQRSACHFQLFEGVAQFSVADAMEIRSEAQPGYQYGEWQQITATYDAGARTSALYVNGRLERKTSVERSVPMDFLHFSIGAWNRGERQYLGLMDDLRIYDRVLETADIEALAQGKDTAVAPIAWWTFDAIQDRGLADASGKGRDARVIGVAPYRGPEVTTMAADMGIPNLRKGFISERPAEDWTKAIVTGNGVMGAMVLGDPLNETIIMNRANLWLPLNKPLPPVDTASHLQEIRDMMRRGEYQKAADFVVKLSHQEGY